MTYAIGGGTKENADGTDVDRFGVHVACQVMAGGKAQFQYEDITDVEGATDASNDWTYVGNADALRLGFSAIGEFRTPDSGTDVAALVLIRETAIPLWTRYSGSSAPWA